LCTLSTAIASVYEGVTREREREREREMVSHTVTMHMKHVSDDRVRDRVARSERVAMAGELVA
jgi:hypothetical protein